MSCSCIACWASEICCSTCSSDPRASSDACCRACWIEVLEMRGQIADGRVAHYQVVLKVGFTLDD
jgi:flavin-binding protein dodecin